MDDQNKPALPNSWKWVELNEIAQNISLTGKKIKQDDYLDEGEFPVIDQGEEKVGGYTNSSSKLIDGNPPFVVFGDHTKVVKYIGYNFAPGADGIKVLSPKDGIHPKLFTYFLKYASKKIPSKGYARHFQYLKKESIPLPPKRSQNKIVEKIEELFSDLNNGVENLKKAKQQLETYKQSVLKAAFAGKLTAAWREQQDDLPTPKALKEQIEAERKKYREQQLEEWRQEIKKWKEHGEPGRKARKPKKLPDFKSIEEKELENLDSVPSSWLWLRTQEIGEWNGGGTPRKSKAEYWEDGSIPWVSPKDMKRKDIATTQDLMTEKALSESSSARMVDKDAILFVTRSGILRRTLPVAISKNDLTINQDLKALTPVIDISSEYIYWYCKANDFKIRRECSKDGTTVESIKTQSLKNYPIPVCSPHEQKQIVEEIESKVSIIQQLTTTIDQELQKAESLHQSILKKAFEGQLE